MNRPKERRSNTWQVSVLTTTLPSTPRKPNNSLWTSGSPEVADTPSTEIRLTEVECVSNFKFLGVHISEDLSWSLNTSKLVKKAQQHLYFLRRLHKAHLSPQILINFYCCTIKSILTTCFTVWYSSCSTANRKALKRVVKTAQHIIGAPLPAITYLHCTWCVRWAQNIIRDHSHTNHGLLSLLPFGRRLRSVRFCISRLRNSFFHSTMTLLNS